MKRIERGEVTVVNPFNRQERIVDLRPEAVHSMVLWSKDFGPFLKAEAHTRLKQMGYKLFFNFTVNAPNAVLEPGIPAVNLRLNQVRTLCRDFSPDQINWRFDPICFYEQDCRSCNTLGGFDIIARAMADRGISRCITSFYDPYRKVDQRVKALIKTGGPKIRFVEPGTEKRRQVIQRMADLLKPLGIGLFLCCEQGVTEALGGDVSPSACIDGHYLQTLFGGSPVKAKDSGQRKDKGCQCTRSVDIGSYDRHPCAHNCLFCYARTGMDTHKRDRQ